MKNNSYLKIKDYFEILVSKHKYINEFVGYFSRDLHSKSASRKGIASPYLALFKYEIGLDGSEQNTVAVRKLGFAVMFNNVAPDDFNKQYEAIDTAEQLALSILARIRFDNNKKEHFLYNSLLKDSIRILPIELSAQSFGVEVYFNLKNPQNLVVNPEDWEDIDEVCS